MDDGYKSGKGFYISSESFTLAENIKLVEILYNKFGLSCSVHNHTNGHRLYVKSNSLAELVNLVQPYFLSHFYYKLNLKDSSD